MPGFTMERVLEQTEDFDIEIDGQNLTGKYIPAIWTGEFLDKLYNMGESKHAGLDLAEMICKGVKEWNVEFDGKGVELKAETLHTTIPFAVLTLILEKLVEALSPKKKSSTRSGSFS